MFLRKKKFVLGFLVSLTLFSFCPFVRAGDEKLGGLRETAKGVGYDDIKVKFGGSIPEIAGNIINAVLVFLGVIFLVLTLYGGFLYLTAAGNEDRVKKAVEIIKRSIIGLLIVLSAYAVTAFIFTTFQPLIPAK